MKEHAQGVCRQEQGNGAEVIHRVLNAHYYLACRLLLV